MVDEFINDLRSVLNNLYDPDLLRQSQLAQSFDKAGRHVTPTALRQILEDAIHSLKPNRIGLPRSPIHRPYFVLQYRYIEQFSQKEVAEQLGISLRQCQREQQTAIKLLASTLLEKHLLLNKNDKSTKEESLTVIDDSNILSKNNFSWMFFKTSQKRANLYKILYSVKNILEPLLERYNVSLDIRLLPDLPVISIHPEAIRQSLINLFSVAIHHVACGQIQVSTKLSEMAVIIQISGNDCSPENITSSNDDQLGIEIAKDLIGRSGGNLNIDTYTTSFKYQVEVPVVESLPIIVIDDNVDNLKLYERFLVGSYYRIIPLSEPVKALEIATNVRPQIIVLDLMMPDIDGWELLNLFGNFPSISDVPIIVASILPQEELALTIGAKKFLRKPFTQQTFLDALDDCVPNLALSNL